VESLSFKTKSANKATVEKGWVVVDADSQILGRLASQVARIIRGKHKASYTPHVDCGDRVIVINADKIYKSGDGALEIATPITVDDLFAVEGDVIVSKPVTGRALVVGGTLVVGGDGLINGDASVGGGKLILAKDNAVTGTLSLNGTIEASGGSRTLNNVEFSGKSSYFITQGSHDITITNDLNTEGDLDIMTSGTGRTVLTGNLDEGGSSGGIQKYGSGILELAANSSHTFSDDSVVHDGQLVLNGDLTTATLDVQGGELLGDGTITGNLIIRSGGKHRIGNSIGTRQVVGNYTLANGATEEIEVDGNAADKLIATGDITLENGSIINVVKIGTGVVRDGETFTIYDAGGTLTDNGAIVTDNSSFLNWTGAIDPTDNTLFIITAEALANFTDRAEPGNNASLGAALDALAGAGATAAQNDLLNDLQAMDTATYNRALRELSPQQTPAVSNVSSDVARAMHGNLNAYLSGNRAGTPAVVQVADATVGLQFVSAAVDPTLVSTMLDASEPQIANAQAQASPWGGFAKGFGAFNNRDSDNNAVGFQANTAGGILGIDRQINDNLLIGGLIGYGHTFLDFDQNRGDGDIESFRLGPYVSYNHADFFIDGSATFGYHLNDINRRSTAGGMNRQNNADYDAWDFNLALNLGYDFEVATRTWLTPIASLEYLYYQSDSYVETGNAGSALAVDSASVDSLRLGVGARAAHAIELDKFTLVPELSVQYIHEFLGDADLSARFVGGPTGFTINSKGQDHSLAVGVGATAILSDKFSAYVRYDGEYNHEGETHAVTVGINFRF